MGRDSPKAISSSPPLGLILLLCLVSTTTALERFWSAVYDKGCGPAEACDCSYSNAMCSADNIEKFCKVCKGDLDIDDRFEGSKATFWKLTEIRGSLNVYERATVKTLDFKWLSTVRLGLQVGGYLSSCPEFLEAILLPALTSVGTGGKSRHYYDDGNYDWGNDKNVDNVPIVIGTPSNNPTPHVARSLGHYDEHYYNSQHYSQDMYSGREDTGCLNLLKLFTPNLLYIGGDLVVRNNPKLASLSFPKLIGVGMLNDPNDYGDIIVEGNDKLVVYYAPTASLATAKYKYKDGYDKIDSSGKHHDVDYYAKMMGDKKSAPTYVIKKNKALQLVVLMSSPGSVSYVDACQNPKSLISIYALPRKIIDGADALYHKIDDFEMKYADTLDVLEENTQKGLAFLGGVLDDKIDFLKFGDGTGKDDGIVDMMASVGYVPKKNAHHYDDDSNYKKTHSYGGPRYKDASTTHSKPTPIVLTTAPGGSGPPVITITGA